ncbi:MAG: hypothetical protein WCL49_05830 [bacterium]
MTKTVPSRKLSMLILALACLIPLPFCIGAFLVNIEMAVRVFSPTFHFFDGLFPHRLFRIWQILSADLSTVSTLIPVMILAFPLAQLIRIHLQRESDPTLVQRLGPDPYPSHFGFFQVMLGLTGTLYGMYIGLDVSGVSQLAGQTPTADSIRQSLDRLLGGTATALLSSLVGLIGAFITARPVPWLFGRVTGVKADETRQTLTSTIERLTDDLRGLSQASRTFTDYLNPDTANTVLQRMDRQEAATRDACTRLDAIVTQLETLNQGQSLQARQLTALEALASIAASSRDKQDQANITLAAIALSQSESAGRLARLESVDQSVQQANALLRRLVEGDEARHQDTLKTLSGLAAAANAQREQLQRDQDALRNALAAYLSPTR